MIAHAAGFVSRNGAHATYEAWIASLHPENISIDRRLTLADSRHLALYRAAFTQVHSSPKDVEAATAIQQTVSDALQGNGHDQVTAPSCRRMSAPPVSSPARSEPVNYSTEQQQWALAWAERKPTTPEAQDGAEEGADPRKRTMSVCSVEGQTGKPCTELLELMRKPELELKTRFKAIKEREDLSDAEKELEIRHLFEQASLDRKLDGAKESPSTSWAQESAGV